MNKFGRLAVFQCSIPHAARPPHSRQTGPRLTFAVKVSASFPEALVRGMSESAVIITSLPAEEQEGDVERVLEELLWGRLDGGESPGEALARLLRARAVKLCVCAVIAAFAAVAAVGAVAATCLGQQ